MRDVAVTGVRTGVLPVCGGGGGGAVDVGVAVVVLCFAGDLFFLFSSFVVWNVIITNMLFFVYNI